MKLLQMIEENTQEDPNHNKESKASLQLSKINRASKASLQYTRTSKAASQSSGDGISS